MFTFVCITPYIRLVCYVFWEANNISEVNLSYAVIWKPIAIAFNSIHVFCQLAFQYDWQLSIRVVLLYKISTDAVHISSAVMNCMTENSLIYFDFRKPHVSYSLRWFQECIFSAVLKHLIMLQLSTTVPDPKLNLIYLNVRRCILRIPWLFCGILSHLILFM